MKDIVLKDFDCLACDKFDWNEMCCKHKLSNNSYLSKGEELYLVEKHEDFIKRECTFIYDCLGYAPRRKNTNFKGRERVERGKVYYNTTDIGRILDKEQGGIQHQKLISNWINQGYLPIAEKTGVICNPRKIVRVQERYTKQEAENILAYIRSPQWQYREPIYLEHNRAKKAKIERVGDKPATYVLSNIKVIEGKNKEIHPF